MGRHLLLACLGAELYHARRYGAPDRGGSRAAQTLSVFVREPSLGLVTLTMVGLMGIFIVVPQVQVVLVPGLDGYVTFFREGPNWLSAAVNSILTMTTSTATAVLLGFVYAYAMVYSN